MMNRQVPGSLQMEDVNYSNNPATHIPKNPAESNGDGVRELLWGNGNVFTQNRQQNDTASASAADPGEVVIQPEGEIRLGGEEQQQQQQNQPLFMQDDEMASWLQYPLEDLYADLLYPSPPTLAPISTITQAEIQYPAPTYDSAPRVNNFGHFSRPPGRPRLDPVNQPPMTGVRESTVEESNNTPMVRPTELRVLAANVESGPAMAGGTLVAAGELGAVVCEPTVTSSASLSFSGEAQMRPEGRKRRARENEDNEYQSEDTEFEADEAREPAHGSSSAKRSRAAEVHNRSERKRRDRINGKMRTLQDLIPRCKKTDKASMLDDAIDYVKTLQMQLQLMSMGYPMVPMMYPGIHQYMSAMGLNMGMNRPMAPYHPPMPPCSTLPNQSYTGPRLPMLSTYPMPLVHTSDPGIQGSGSNLADHVVNFSPFQNLSGLPNFADPYQQFVDMLQGQYPTQLDQQVFQPGSNRLITGEDTGNPDTQIG